MVNYLKLFLVGLVHKIVNSCKKSDSIILYIVTDPTIIKFLIPKLENKKGPQINSAGLFFF
jgi:hypothetical protein